MRENLTYGLMRRGRNYLPFTLAKWGSVTHFNARGRIGVVDVLGTL